MKKVFCDICENPVPLERQSGGELFMAVVKKIAGPVDLCDTHHAALQEVVTTAISTFLWGEARRSPVQVPLPGTCQPRARSGYNTAEMMRDFYVLLQKVRTRDEVREYMAARYPEYRPTTFTNMLSEYVNKEKANDRIGKYIEEWVQGTRLLRTGTYNATFVWNFAAAEVNHG